MPKGKKIKVGIYHPPKSGMLYLVVTVSPEGVLATARRIKRRSKSFSVEKDAGRYD